MKNAQLGSSVHLGVQCRVGPAGGRSDLHVDGMASSDRSADPLAGWSAPWRVTAVLTGCLPVGGALRGRPPYEHRVCSAPVAVGVVTSLLITFSGATYLMPSVLQAFKVNMHLAALFELVTFVSLSASVWLTVVRGPSAARLLREVGRLLEARQLRGLLTTDSSRGRFILVDLIMLVKTAICIWELYKKESVLAPGITQMPNLLLYALDMATRLRGAALLTLCIHLMRVLGEEFDTISASLRRALHPATGKRVCRVSVTSASRRQAWDHDGNIKTPSALLRGLDLRVLCSPDSPLPPRSCADEIATQRTLFLAAADVTALFNATLALPALCMLCQNLSVSIAILGTMPLSQPFDAHTVMSVWSAVEAVGFAALLCHQGQRLEEAARRPALLLLRHPPEDPAAAEEAARLVALSDGLRPAVGVSANSSVNNSLLVSVATLAATFMLVLLQMK